MKIDIDIKKLQQDTADFINAGVLKKERDDALMEARRRDKDEADVRRAMTIVSEIPHICEKAAAKGKVCADILKVVETSFLRPMGNYSTDPKYLTGTAKHVWDSCVDANLNTKLDYRHDGIGNHSWHFIVVNWEKGA